MKQLLTLSLSILTAITAFAVQEKTDVTATYVKNASFEADAITSLQAKTDWLTAHRLTTCVWDGVQEPPPCDRPFRRYPRANTNYLPAFARPMPTQQHHPLN